MTPARARTTRLFWPLFAAWLGLACATTPRPTPDRDVRVDGGEKPAWASGTESSSRFLGVSSNASDPDAAIAEATANARLAIVRSLGVEVSSEQLERATHVVDEGGTESRVEVDRRVRTAASAVVQVEPSKTHLERWRTRDEEGGVRDYWRAYVLVPFSEETHRRFLGRMADEAVTAVESALEEAERRIDEGRFEAAVESFARASQPGRELLERTGTPPEVRGRVADARRRVEARIQRFLDRLTVSVRPASWRGLRRRLYRTEFRVRCRLDRAAAEATSEPSDETSADVRPGSLEVELSFAEGSGELPSHVTTDDSDGDAAFRVDAVEGHADRYVVRARPRLRALDDRDLEGVPHADLELQPDPGHIAVTIGETPKDGEQAVARWVEELRSALTRRGYEVERVQESSASSSTHEADYRLNVALRAPVRETASNYRASLEASVELRVPDGELLWSWSFPDERFEVEPASASRADSAVRRVVEEARQKLLFEWIAANVERGT